MRGNSCIFRIFKTLFFVLSLVDCLLALFGFSFVVVFLVFFLVFFSDVDLHNVASYPLT